jgi:hypothetical protein
MNALLNRLSTPLTVGFFAVSAISGVALFFHWAQGTFHEMHEWLSMVLLLPFILHLWRNWRALVAYAARGALYLPVGVTLLVALLFATSAMSGGGRGGPPSRTVVELMTKSSLADLAPVLKTTPEHLLTALRQRGYVVNSTDETLAAVASSTGIPAPELLFSLLSP